MQAPAVPLCTPMPQSCGALARCTTARRAAWAATALAVLVLSGQAAATDLNTASEADLDAIRGSGPATTARILAARHQAPFASWADVVQRVRGVGAATAARWSAQGVTVDGQPWEPSAGHGYPPFTHAPLPLNNR